MTKAEFLDQPTELPVPRRGRLVRERSRTAAGVCWDITVTDDDGTVTVTVEIDGCRLRRKAIGVGLTLAALLDATAVRGLLPPAVMRLAGRAQLVDTHVAQGSRPHASS